MERSNDDKEAREDRNRTSKAEGSEETVERALENDERTRDDDRESRG